MGRTSRSIARRGFAPTAKVDLFGLFGGSVVVMSLMLWFRKRTRWSRTGSRFQLGSTGSSLSSVAVLLLLVFDSLTISLMTAVTKMHITVAYMSSWLATIPTLPDQTMLMFQCILSDYLWLWRTCRTHTFFFYSSRGFIVKKKGVGTFDCSSKIGLMAVFA